MEEESILRIGDGRSINVFANKWVCDLHGFKILYVHEDFVSSHLVSDFIVPNGSSWDIEVLENCFDFQ